MSLKTYLIRCKKANLIWFFWLLLNSLCVLANGHLSALALTSLVAQRLSDFACFTGLTLLNYLVWMVQIRQINPARERAIQTMNQAIRSDILVHLAKTSAASVQETGADTYTSWLTNDITTINDQGFETLEYMLSQAMNLIFSALSLMAYHPSFAVSVITLSLLMSQIPKLFDTKLADKALLFSQRNEALLAVISQTLRGFPVLYGAGRLGQLQSRVREPEQGYAQSRIAYQTVFGQFMALQNGLSFLSQLAILTQASLLFAWKLVPIGAVSSSPYFASVTFAGLTGFFANWAEIKSLQPIWDKFQSLPQVEQADWSKSLGQAPNLTTSKLELQLPGQVSLSFPDLMFEAGNHYLIKGASGVGKSSLLSLLAGRLKPSQGQISLDGQLITQTDLLPLVSLVPQEAFIFDDSLRYNLTLGRELADSDLLAGLDQLGLTTFYQQLPKGLDSQISLDSLSGGQAQRLCLLRALLEDRPILLLDEVTSALDQDTQELVEQFLSNLTDKTIIQVSHQETSLAKVQLITL